MPGHNTAWSLVTVELELGYAKERAALRMIEARRELRKAAELGEEIAHELGEETFDALVAVMMRMTLESHMGQGGTVARLQLRIAVCADIIATCEAILRPEVVAVLGGSALIACLDTPVATQLDSLERPCRDPDH